MGIWARKTRLSWRWSQIRFETKYTTPELRLSSGLFEEDAAAQTMPKPRKRIVYRIPIIGWLTEVFNGPPRDWTGYFEITSDRREVPLEMRKTTRRRSVTILPNSRAEDWSLSIIRIWDSSYADDSPDIVSWPRLLRSIYANQIQSIRKIQPQYANGLSPPSNGAHSPLGAEKLEEGKKKLEEEEPYRPMTDDERGDAEDRVVARLVERSWDLLPPDVVRYA